MVTETIPNSTGLTESDIIRRYYTDRDYFLSPEGILKALSAILCVATTALFMGGATCSDAPTVLQSMNIALMVFGALLCFVYTTVLLELPQYAPQFWLYADIIMSSATGVIMLIVAAISAFTCAMTDFFNALYFPLVLLNTVLLTTSTVVMYINVMSQSDAARPAPQPRALPAVEQEV